MEEEREERERRNNNYMSIPYKSDLCMSQDSKGVGVAYSSFMDFFFLFIVFSLIYLFILFIRSIFTYARSFLFSGH